jgi:hypothetical protein
MGNYQDIDFSKAVRAAAAFTATAASGAVSLVDYAGPNVAFVQTTVRTSGSLTGYIQANPAGDTGATSFYSVGTFATTNHSVALEADTGTMQVQALGLSDFPGGYCRWYGQKHGDTVSHVVACSVHGHSNS